MSGPPTACPGCGALVALRDGPTHAYMVASPACWAAYGTVLAREYGDPTFGASHQMSVDAYGAQHPGNESPQTIRSVALHLIGLQLALEGERTAGSHPGCTSTPGERPSRFHVAPATGVPGRRHGARRRVSGDRRRPWRRGPPLAHSAWDAWSAHHAAVRGWVAAAGLDGR